VARLFDKVVARLPRSGRDETFRHLSKGLRDFATPLVCDDAIRRCPTFAPWDTLSAVRVPFPVTLIEWRNNNDDDEIGVVAFELGPVDVSPAGTAATIVMRAVAAQSEPGARLGCRR
jgi:hypothetical protein